MACISCVVNCSIADVESAYFDVAIYCSSFERRCTYVAQKLHEIRAGHVVVLGTCEQADHPARVESDSIFRSAFGRRSIELPNSSDASVFGTFNELSSCQGSLKIFLDYSAMPRSWYATVLNWLRYSTHGNMSQVMFAYAPAIYGLGEAPRVITGVKCITDCEDAQFPTRSSVAFSGLGLDSVAPLTARDYMKPDETFAIVADPGADLTSAKRALEANEDFLSDVGPDKIIWAPFHSIEKTLRTPTEIVTPYRGAWNITAIPIGPKPHVLATLLLAILVEEVSCLYVDTRPVLPPTRDA
jgi:hypothetical protein